VILGHYRLNIWGFQYTLEEQKLSCWAGKLLSYGDMLTLINFVLTSLPMFMLSFLEIPVGVRKLDFF
jgi:hypothetical protein